MSSGVDAISASAPQDRLSSATSKEKVRVAYILYNGYQEGGEGQHKQGTGYEYLKKIAAYANWEYEYVYGSFSELLKGVEEGTIDLMGNISKAPDRLSRWDYGKLPEGQEEYLLVVPSGATDILRSNLSTLAGKRVGIAEKSVMKPLFEKWLAEKGIDGVEIVGYQTVVARMTDWTAGQLDAMVVPMVGRSADWSTVAVIGKNDYYYVTNKRKPWLKEALDAAQERINLLEPHVDVRLREKYLNYTSERLPLGHVEEAWIKAKGSVRVGYRRNAAPYTVEGQGGAFHGVFEPLFEKLKANYGLSAEFLPFETYGEMNDALAQGQVDVIVPILYDHWLAEEQGLVIGNEYASHYLLEATKTGNEANLRRRIAVNKASAVQQFVVRFRYPDAVFIEMNDFAECLNAVRDGHADTTFIGSATLSRIGKIYGMMDGLTFTETSQSSAVTFAVRQGERTLLTILNKALASVNSFDIGRSLATAIVPPGERVSLTAFVKSNLLAVMVGLATVVSIFVAVLIACGVLSNKNEQLSAQKTKLEKTLRDYDEMMGKFREADFDRRRDALTGLFNRHALAKLDEDEPGRPVRALWMLDIDDFKAFNDQFGHQAGDACLSAVGRLLRGYALENKLLAYRYGGEELLLLDLDGNKAPIQIANDLVDLVARLNIVRPDSPFGHVTTSIGCTGVQASFDDMLAEADKALYEAKRRGKNQAVCACKL